MLKVSNEYRHYFMATFCLYIDRKVLDRCFQANLWKVDSESVRQFNYFFIEINIQYILIYYQNLNMYFPSYFQAVIRICVFLIRFEYLIIYIFKFSLFQLIIINYF